MARARSSIKAVVLAGGLGTRLRPYTFFLPKPMLPVGGVPIIERIVRWLAANGIEDVVISTGYLGKTIEEHLGDGARLGVAIDYARSGEPLGIAGQLKNAESKVGDTFLCLYGDAILDFDLRSLVSFHKRRKALLTMALMAHRIEEKYGVIDLEKDGRIAGWREKPVVENAINVGCYVMEKRYMRYIPADSVYGMKEAFDAAMAAKERLYGLRVDGTFLDIGDKKTYREADAMYSRLGGAES